MVDLVRTSVPRLLEGMQTTILLTAATLVLGLVLACLVAAAHTARRAWLRWAAEGYILFFRGTPALVQVFLLYYGAGQFAAVRDSVLWTVLREPFWCAVIALGLNSGAYVGRMLSGALKTLPRGPVEAGSALGLSAWGAMRTIKAPLVARAILPAYCNEVILTLKATSLASTITILELTGTARSIVAETYAPFEVFALAGVIYLALNVVITRLFDALERAWRIPG